MTLNWEISDADAALIRKIADRAMTGTLGKQLRDNHIAHLDVTMSVQACHANGNPLDLAALLEFPPFDFSHDITGIIGYLDHDTGKLTNFFSPRCTARQPVLTVDASKLADVHAEADARAYIETLIERIESVD